MKTLSYETRKYSLLLVAGCCISIGNPASTQEWTSITPLYGSNTDPVWSAFACSADGNRLVAGGAKHAEELWYAMSLYTSADSGLTWTQTSAPPNVWVAAASSADGKCLIAASVSSFVASSSSDAIYTSNDYGMSWVKTAVPSDIRWSSVASSSDGTRLAALGGNDDGLMEIHTSDDSGLTWVQRVLALDYWPWGSGRIVSSADGQTVFVVDDSGGLHRSGDAGLTWTLPTNAPACSSLAVSADGVRLASAAAEGGPIYTSSDSGMTWTGTTAKSSFWRSIASSADRRVLQASGDGQLHVSIDAGATWTSSPTVADFTGLACSADGKKLFVESGPYLFASSYLGPWKSSSYPVSHPAYYSSMAASADGIRLVASEPGGAIYTSTNSGATWMPGNLAVSCVSVASSSDGNTLLAAGARTGVYISTNGGFTWTLGPSSPYGGSVACSADGAVMFSAAYSTLLTSTNSGKAWLKTGPTNSAYNVVCSVDGTKILAAFLSDSNTFTPSILRYSANAGATWELTGPSGEGWFSLASSADGSTLVAMDSSGIYTSTNSGATWGTAPITGFDTRGSLSTVACSGDGTKLLALVDNYRSGAVLISTDSGATWTSTCAPGIQWMSIACSRDGSTVVACSTSEGNGSGSYTLQLPLPASPPVDLPGLTIGSNAKDIVLSWLVPSSNFSLQEKSDWSTTNWTSVATAPLLNFTNLHNEVNVSPTFGSHFYRLKHE